jgi:diadenosine tetraphosphate (Ap4A) HIT family hydrolase
MSECIFCNCNNSEIIAENRWAFAILDHSPANVGVHAGQTIEHMHVHLIPRYVGDVIDPRGGVRNLKEALKE